MSSSQEEDGSKCKEMPLIFVLSAARLSLYEYLKTNTMQITLNVTISAIEADAKELLRLQSDISFCFYLNPEKFSLTNIQKSIETS